MFTDSTNLKVCYLHVGLWNVCVLNVFKTSNLGFAVLGPEEQLSRLVHLDEFIALPLVVAKFATNVMCTCGFLVCCSFMMWTWIDCWPDVMIMTDHRTKPFRQCRDLATTITFYKLVAGSVFLPHCFPVKKHYDINSVHTILLNITPHQCFLPCYLAELKDDGNLPSRL